MFKLSSTSLKRREGVDARLIEIDDLAISITVVDYGHPEHSGLRTAEVQHELYLGGESSCDGYDLVSNHQLGKALDFYAYVNGKASWETEHLAMVACAYLQAASMLGHKLKWGGLFKPTKTHLGKDYKGGWDYPHVELDC